MFQVTEELLACELFGIGGDLALTVCFKKVWLFGWRVQKQRHLPLWASPSYAQVRGTDNTFYVVSTHVLEKGGGGGLRPIPRYFMFPRWFASNLVWFNACC